MPRDVRTWLFDIQQACSLLAEFTSGKSLDDYRSDAMLRSAVERQFEIIGEALSQFLRVSPALGSRISNPRQIIAFRNRLIHGYATIDDEVVWGVLEASLPMLIRDIEELLSESQSGGEVAQQ